MMDVVYLCREGANEELRYSTRSVAKHLPHGELFLIGGAPDWFSGNLIDRPTLGTKYLTTTAHMRHACENPDISDQFILMNDDFFITDPVPGVPHLNRGTVNEVIAHYRSKNRNTGYLRGMIETRNLLIELGHEDPLSYELHVPLIVDKALMLEALDIGQQSSIEVLHKRSLYGNHAGLGGDTIEDVKVYTMEQELPRGPWLSSCDAVFKYGVGNVMRWLFPDPSRYEA